MRFLFTSFDFYKKFLLVSFLLTLLLLGLGTEIVVIVFIKIFGALLLWGWYRTEGRKQLIFYHNFGWNSVSLVLFGLGYDLLIFVPLAIISQQLG